MYLRVFIHVSMRIYVQLRAATCITRVHVYLGDFAAGGSQQDLRRGAYTQLPRSLKSKKEKERKREALGIAGVSNVNPRYNENPKNTA